MRVELRVIVNGQYFNGGASITLPELQAKCFEPVRTCDDRTTAYITGDLPIYSEEVRVILKTRDDAAKLLSEALAKTIISEMKKNDTHNGYRREL